MAYAIMRINKCKSGAVGGLQKHHEREKEKYKSNETAAFIINKMRSLPRTEGRRLYMKYVLGLETDEIAHLEKVCPEAIRNSLRRGLAHVYQLFENSEVINNDKKN